jgi:hypothetical protein
MRCFLKPRSRHHVYICMSATRLKNVLFVCSPAGGCGAQPGAVHLVVRRLLPQYSGHRAARPDPAGDLRGGPQRATARKELVFDCVWPRRPGDWHLHQHQRHHSRVFLVTPSLKKTANKRQFFGFVSLWICMPVKL